jgi:photosystem II stability/assembly factor-like uncharacterized protein
MKKGERIQVATRKGLFTLSRGAGDGWAITNSAFLGDPVTIVLDDPRDGTLYAALNLGHFGIKLRRSEDGGKTWEEASHPSFPQEPGDGLDATPSGPSVHQIWALEPGGADEEGKLWAGTIPGGLFVSDDRGANWRLVESLWDRPERSNWFGGGYDDPGIHSICVDPRDSSNVAVGVSCGGVWITEDGGQSWECRTKGMFAAYMPPERREDPSIQDPHCVAQCPANPDVLWVQHHNGVFKSSDRARQWQEISDVEPSVFGFAVAVHPADPDTAWLVPAVKDECRIPVDGKVVVARTRDGGKSFDVLRKGLPQENAYDLVYRHAFDVDGSGERLVMGSTTGSLWISEDAGETWATISNHLPPIYQLRFSP